MDVETVRVLLAWCTLINWIVLFLWWGLFSVAGDWIYALHGKWFKLSRETFDAIHYAGMALFKLVILVFNFVPYLVLQLFFV